MTPQLIQNLTSIYMRGANVTASNRDSTEFDRICPQLYSGA